MTNQVKLLWDSVSQGNYSNAWKIIDAGLAQSPNHPYWLAVAGFVCCKQGRKLESLKHCQQVLDLKPSNVSVVSLVAQAYITYGLGDLLNQMYDQAVKKVISQGSSSDNDEQLVELLDLWVDGCICTGNFKGLNRASVVGQQKLAERHLTYQGVMATCLAIKNKQYANENEKKIMCMVALRTLDKAITEDSANAQEEAYVRAELLKLSGQDSQLIEFLLDAKKHNSLELMVMLVTELERLERWDVLFQECEQLTKPSAVAELDSWLYWKLLVVSGVKLGKEQALKDELLVGESRNVMLARVYLDDTMGMLKQSGSVESSLYRYTERHGNKRCCFEDISVYLERIDDLAKYVQWMEHHTQYKKDVTWRVNAAKFRAKMSSENRLDVKQLTELYSQSLDGIDKKDITDYHSGDDFLILAVEKILSSSSSIEESSGRLMKAAVLLEIAAKYDKHQFYVRIWLIHIYTALGAYSLAVSHYDTLSIKMMQIESLSYLVASRSSAACPSEKTLSMLGTFNDLYRQTDEIVQYVKHAYQKGVYSQVGGFHELYSKLENSLSHMMMQIEQVRVTRILGKTINTVFFERYNVHGDEISTQQATFIDNRDTAIWRGQNDDFGLSDRPAPDDKWVRAHVLRELIIRKLAVSAAAESRAALVVELQEIVNDEEKKASSSLTAAELAAMRMVMALARQEYRSIRSIMDSIRIDDQGRGTTICDFVHNANIYKECTAVIGGLIQILKSRKTEQISPDLLSVEKYIREQVQDTICKTADGVKRRLEADRRAIVNNCVEWADSLKLDKDIAERVADDVIKSQTECLSVVKKIKR